MNSRIMKLLISLIFIIFGIVFIVMHFTNLSKYTGEVEATVVNVAKEEEFDSDGFSTTYYTPIVSYTVNGETYETQLSIRSNISTEYKVGDKYTLIYNPENPKECSVKGDNGSLIGGIVFGVIGLLLGVITVIKG